MIPMGIIAIGNEGFAHEGFSHFHMHKIAQLTMIIVGLIGSIGMIFINDYNAKWDEDVQYLPSLSIPC